MFLDLALLWQPRSFPIRKTSQNCHERNPNFPSWSWTRWKGGIDDRFWQKCFNHIFLLSGLTEDYVEIGPLVQWYKRSSKTQKLRLVSNSYHSLRPAAHMKADLLPPNWSQDGKENGYRWKHQDDPRKRFRYPIPIPPLWKSKAMTYLSLIYISRRTELGYIFAPLLWVWVQVGVLQFLCTISLTIGLVLCVSIQTKNFQSQKQEREGMSSSQYLSERFRLFWI